MLKKVFLLIMLCNFSLHGMAEKNDFLNRTLEQIGGPVGYVDYIKNAAVLITLNKVTENEPSLNDILHILNYKKEHYEKHVIPACSQVLINDKFFIGKIKNNGGEKEDKLFLFNLAAKKEKIYTRVYRFNHFFLTKKHLIIVDNKNFENLYKINADLSLNRVSDTHGRYCFITPSNSPLMAHLISGDRHLFTPIKGKNIFEKSSTYKISQDEKIIGAFEDPEKNVNIISSKNGHISVYSASSSDPIASFKIGWDYNSRPNLKAGFSPSANYFIAYANDQIFKLGISYENKALKLKNDIFVKNRKLIHVSISDEGDMIANEE